MNELDTAIEAAHAAGKVLMEHLGRLKDVRYKSVRDPVSEADRESEALIARIIREAYPEHGFLGEEDSSWEPSGSGGPRWIVDPLDGTVNYAHAYPCFCVSIALEAAGALLLGVVHDPFNRETDTAARAGGAYLNKEEIRVSGTDELIRSLVVTGFPYDTAENTGVIMRDMEAMIRASQGVRRDGAAALDLCYLAAGRFDGFWELRLKPWDTAAGVVIVEEAGGRVTTYGGGPYTPYMDNILASNGLVHDEMVRVLNP